MQQMVLLVDIPVLTPALSTASCSASAAAARLLLVYKSLTSCNIFHANRITHFLISPLHPSASSYPAVRMRFISMCALVLSHLVTLRLTLHSSHCVWSCDCSNRIRHQHRRCASQTQPISRQQHTKPMRAGRIEQRKCQRPAIQLARMSNKR